VKVASRADSNLVGQPSKGEQVSSLVSVLINAAPIIDRCIAGDEAAWRELHRAYYPQVGRFLRRLGVPPVETDDLCQDVFAQVVRYLPRFEGRADFRTWLFKLCISQVNRRRRFRWPALLRPGRARHERDRGLVAVDLRLEALAGPTLPEFSQVEMARRAQLALQHMKPAHRAVLVLFELEGLSGEEIARVVGAPVATVWRRLSYARREFEQWINEGPFHPPTGERP
jgi:RNA polymerase sigma-70 factor (ECF subfamily)